MMENVTQPLANFFVRVLFTIQNKFLPDFHCV
jgi:hypothetical protein